MTREEFFQLIWTRPVRWIAEDYNVMPLDIRRLMKVYEVPMLGRTHWVQFNRGDLRKKAPALPAHTRPEAMPDVWPLLKPSGETVGRFTLFVPGQRPKRLHPAATATDKAIVAAADPENISLSGAGLFPCSTKLEDRDRAVLFIHALLTALEKIGFPMCAAGSLEIRCFGLWFAFRLQYETPSTSIRSGKECVALQVIPLSPAHKGRYSGAFYGRGDKPIEAAFNTILLWLMHTARTTLDAEAKWSRSEKEKHGTDQERFDRRRAAERQTEAARVKAEAELKRQEAEEQEERKKAEIITNAAAPFPRFPTLEQIYARRNARVKRDKSARYTSQESFLWVVQTVLLTRIKLPDCGSHYDEEMHPETFELIQLLLKANTLSHFIPRGMNIGQATEDFFLSYLPEGAVWRSSFEYEYPDWLGEFTKEENEMLRLARNRQRRNERKAKKSRLPD